MHIRTISLAVSVGVLLATALGALLVAESLASTLVRADKAARATGPVPGPVVPDFGASYLVGRTGLATPMMADLKVRFDVGDTAASPSAINPTLENAARFLNMHTQAGVSPTHLKAAVVVHGSAAKDVLKNDAYRARHGVDNPNTPLLKALAGAGVEVYVCGQTAGSEGILSSELEAPAEMALSATTAHLVLDLKGYTLNPF